MYIPRIYLDTSVIGGCFDDEFKAYSNQLFEEFISGKKKAVISDIVLLELEGAPKNVQGVLSKVSGINSEYVFLNEESITLADTYLKEGVIAEGSFSDARHIAIATRRTMGSDLTIDFRVCLEKGRGSVLLSCP